MYHQIWICTREINWGKETSFHSSSLQYGRQKIKCMARIQCGISHRSMPAMRNSSRVGERYKWDYYRDTVRAESWKMGLDVLTTSSTGFQMLSVLPLMSVPAGWPSGHRWNGQHLAQALCQPQVWCKHSHRRNPERQWVTPMGPYLTMEAGSQWINTVSFHRLHGQLWEQTPMSEEEMIVLSNICK